MTCTLNGWWSVLGFNLLVQYMLWTKWYRRLLIMFSLPRILRYLRKPLVTPSPSHLHLEHHFLFIIAVLGVTSFRLSTSIPVLHPSHI